MYVLYNKLCCCNMMCICIYIYIYCRAQADWLTGWWASRKHTKQETTVIARSDTTLTTVKPFD